MPYSPSYPLTRWRGARRDAIDALEVAHATMGEVDGPGRPLEIGRPIAHAYVLRIVAEFQAYARDVHDLAVEKTVELASADAKHRPLLTTAATEGRNLDRGNADLRSLTNDFRRIGMNGLSGRIEARNGYWLPTKTRRGDRLFFRDLIALRNCLAHGNQGQLDTLSWGRKRLPGLDRIAGAIDRSVWDHLTTVFASEPW